MATKKSSEPRSRRTSQHPSTPTEPPANTISATATETTPRNSQTLKNKVLNIGSKEEFEKIISEAGNKLVLVEFYASWCGPCKLVAAKLEEWANLYIEKMIILKIDVDDFEEIAIEYEVTSMPTLILLQKGKKLRQLVGSNTDNILKNIEKYIQELSSGGVPEPTGNARPRSSTTGSPAPAPENKKK